MLFNTIDFLVFFIAVTAGYFALPHRWRWALLLIASCGFYMAFVPVYILILLATIVIDYYAGRWIEDTDDPAKKRRYLGISIVSVTAILFVFKYFNFANGNVAALAHALGWNYSLAALDIVLPIGLSFHTFQSLSYVVEVYRGKQKAERHFGIYALYVMYYPQLVAGPIERPQNLLHQFHAKHHFDANRVRDGLMLTLWGLFKKVVVADTAAIYVDAVYNNADKHTGASLLLATWLFAWQIYCDFSGYSDMARGLSRVYGIELMMNFDSPYQSRTITEFWTRWHISLSSWFRDYLYIPLGGNRGTAARTYFNLFAVFLVSGLWHGANWTFIAWGALHGVYQVAERLWLPLRPKLLGRFGRGDPGPLWKLWQNIFIFNLVALTWVFFRAPSITVAVRIVARIFTDFGSVFLDPWLAQVAVVLGVGVALDYYYRSTKFFDRLAQRAPSIRLAHSLALAAALLLFGVELGSNFIYFQF
ncbi:MAG: MBOAT family protein [Deltaproteobacteria bacterium]|nr:MBOAT family protein [Deltaproteobacteria bacterium]